MKTNHLKSLRDNESRGDKYPVDIAAACPTQAQTRLEIKSTPFLVPSAEEHLKNPDNPVPDTEDQRRRYRVKSPEASYKFAPHPATSVSTRQPDPEVEDMHKTTKKIPRLSLFKVCQSKRRFRMQQDHLVMGEHEIERCVQPQKTTF